MGPAIIASATTALATTVITKSLESPLKTVNDLWDGAIGHRIAAWSEKQRIQVFRNVKDFKQDLADEVNKIPIDSIQDPQISIVGPTLEASKYYMDEEELRLMFARIIAASMDSRKNGYVQHSFVEIIKQMTPLDAQIFKSMNASEPIVNISIELDNNAGSRTIYQDLFIHPFFKNNGLNSISINNLNRLGLIDVKYDTYLADASIYEAFKNTQEYCQVQKMCENDSENGNPKTPEIEKGLITITNFGTVFKKICTS